MILLEGCNVPCQGGGQQAESLGCCDNEFGHDCSGSREPWVDLGKECTVVSLALEDGGSYSGRVVGWIGDRRDCSCLLRRKVTVVKGGQLQLICCAA